MEDLGKQESKASSNVRVGSADDGGQQHGPGEQAGAIRTTPSGGAPPLSPAPARAEMWRSSTSSLKRNPLRNMSRESRDWTVEAKSHEDSCSKLLGLVESIRSAILSSPNNLDAAYHQFSKHKDTCFHLCHAILDGGSHPALGVRRRSVAIGKLKNCLQAMAAGFQVSIADTYKSFERDVTPEMVDLLFSSKRFRREALLRMRNVIVTSIRDADPQLVPRYEIRFRDYEKVKQALSETHRLLWCAETGISPWRPIELINIAPRGDSILEFANLVTNPAVDEPVLRFRVSSYMLAETSPIFARIFSRHAASSHEADDISGQLPWLSSIHICADGSEVKLYHMPQHEVNRLGSMEVLLHSAHVHRELVPQEVSFDQFVAIAECSLRYKSTSPLEAFVEHRWLPQWRHKFAEVAMLDGLLTISYAFGIRQLFTRTSKCAILHLIDERDLQRKPWPQKIKDKIWAVRCDKVVQVYACRASAFQEYMPAVDPATRPSMSFRLDLWKRLSGSAAASDPALALMSSPRCPKGSHTCDATKLGWMVLALNEMGLLPRFMRPPEVEARPRSFAQLVDVLRRIPSPAFPAHPGVCDPAPPLRAAINNICDSIEGLTLYDISGKSHGWALSKHQMDEPQLATERLAVRDQAYTAAGGLPDYVRLCILDQLRSVDDLQAAARTNKGFYQTYQGHKVFLVRKFLRRDQSHGSSSRELAGNVDDGKVLEPVSGQKKGEGPAMRANLDAMILRSDDASDVSKSEPESASASESGSGYDIFHYDSISTPQAHGRPPAYPPSYAESTEAPMTNEEAARILWPQPLYPSPPARLVTGIEGLHENFRLDNPCFAESLEEKRLITMDQEQLSSEHDRLTGPGKGKGPAMQSDLDAVTLRCQGESNVPESKFRSEVKSEAGDDTFSNDSSSTPQSHGRSGARLPRHAESEDSTCHAPADTDTPRPTLGERPVTPSQLRKPPSLSPASTPASPSGSPASTSEKRSITSDKEVEMIKRRVSDHEDVDDGVKDDIVVQQGSSVMISASDPAGVSDLDTASQTADQYDRTPTQYRKAPSRRTLSRREHFIRELAADMLSKVACERSQTDVSAILPELLQTLALKGFHNAPTQRHRDLMAFVHRHSREIAEAFKDSTRHSSVSGVNARKRDKPLPTIIVEDPNDIIAMKRARDTLTARKSRERKTQRVEDLEERIEKLEAERGHRQARNDASLGKATDNMDRMNLHERMSLWEEKESLDEVPSRDDSEGVDPEGLDPHGGYEEAEFEEAPEDLFYSFRELLHDTEAYEWFLTRLQREFRLVSTEPNAIQQIRNQIRSSLPSADRISRKKDWQSCGAAFELDWDITEFFKTQRYSNRPDQVLRGVITLTGSCRDAQATTCSQYMRQTWPLTGEEMLQLVEKTLKCEEGHSQQCKLSDGTELTAWISRPKFMVKAHGTAISIVEAGEQLAWLGAALRTSSRKSGLLLCRPTIRKSLQNHSPHEVVPSSIDITCEIGFEMEEIAQSPGTADGQCWHEIFRNPVVVNSYPIPRRSEWGTGLEIPLNIMAALARTRRVDQFHEKVYIKGFSTMLIPTKQSEDIILWHLTYNRDGSRISYLNDDVGQEQQIGRLDLNRFRHVLGWCSEARFYAGSSQSHHPVAHSRLPKPHAGCALAKTFVSPGRMIIGGPDFEIGAKDTPFHVSRNGYIPRLKWISTKFVLLWDEYDKRGWLINGTSALLHLVRASLHHDSEDKFRSAFLFKEEDLQESARPFTADSAIDVLINSKNLGLKLYPEKDGYLILENRIDHYFNVLEKLIDHQARIAGDCGSRLRDKPRKHLEGWDFEDLATTRDPLHPRVATLEARGKGWVDFVRAIHAVTMVGRGFGDVIRPVGVDVCEYWAELPKQQYYLASCLSDLSDVTKEHGSYGDGQVRLSDNLIWHVPADVVASCRCRGILGRAHCEPVQTLFPTALSGIVLRRRHPIPLEGRGAVIFGHSSSFPWVWADTGHPQEGELGEETDQDSGIGPSLKQPESEGDVSSRTTSSTSHSKGCWSEHHNNLPRVSGDDELHDRTKYRVGILCALPKELMAVRALFDRKHHGLETAPCDSNQYALGQMAQHLVVAACLPAGGYGTNSAAMAATNMTHSFPRIRFCLLVGIGGGAPSEENDIRLGDVVVSMPTRTFPGVIQYDLGKEKESSVFELTGALPPPLPVLMTAISALRSDPDLRCNPLGVHLRKITDRIPEYSRPDGELDVLLRSSACVACRSRKTCASVSSHVEQRLPRATAEPVIHYGLVASGNRVIKDAAFRDRLADEFGALCFEMEAAGAAKAFPCLVIRGICDYCDAQKNDVWQEYAAATAAAYAKLLIGVVAKEDDTTITSSIRSFTEGGTRLQMRHGAEWSQRNKWT